MPSISAAPLRRLRLRTSLALTAAAGAIAAAAMMTPRGPGPRPGAAPAVGSPLLSAALVSTHVLPGSQDSYLAVSLGAPTEDVARRGPAAVAIVLDRSTSMRGIAFEQARAAAIELVDRLGPADEVTLISYSTEARVEVPLTVADAAGQARVVAALRELRAEGSTNIGAALQLGTAALGSAHRGAVHRVVLISDGRPVAGITEPAALIRLAATAAAGASITTVGVGLEYNEELMAGIAMAGRGRYYFVEHTSQLAQMFQDELEDLGQTLIVGGTLVVTPAAGVRIVEVLGYPWQSGAGGEVLVPVADLRQGERTKVVLRVIADVDGRAPSVAIAAVQWQFRRADGTGGDLRLDATATALVTTDRSVIEANRDRDTVRLIEQARTAAAIEEAATAYVDGRVDRVHAILQGRAQEARDLGDADLEREIRTATDAAQSGFAAPAAAPAGMRALKATRAGAYKMSR